MMASARSDVSTLPVVLVTGCGTGLGLELAKRLYDNDSYRTIATAREHHLPSLRARFKETNRFQIHVLDVNSDENIYRLVQNVCSEWGRIDVIINNAAVCFRGVIEHMDSEAEFLQLKTNYLGPMSLIRAVLPIMREQGSGHIINVSSASGILAMPTMGSYSASKHALEGATEALWYEAKPFGIKVNLIDLGFINSEAHLQVKLSNKAEVSLSLNGPHSEYYRSMTPFIERLMALSPSSPAQVSKRILRIVEKGPTHLKVFATPDVFLFDLMRRLIPSRFFYGLLFMVLPGSVKWGGRWKRKPPISYRSQLERRL